MLTKQQVIERLCSITSDTASAMDWQHPADCFCGGTGPMFDGFQFSEKVLDEIEVAVSKHIREWWMA